MYLSARPVKPRKQAIRARSASFAFVAMVCATVICLAFQPGSLALDAVPETPAELIRGSYLDARELQVQISGRASVSLVGSGSGDLLRATVAYVPATAGELTAVPEPKSLDPLVFEWDQVSAGKYGYRYDTVVTSFADIPRLTEPIAYPFVAPPDIAEYLRPQKYTDTNPQIRAQANSLVGSERDALKVVYSLASWTRTNVRYDLRSIAADATETSSWVFENREGVCDELTSLFISLSREAGIPARFVSGLAYTNLPEFDNPWQAHGWAEVWLPNHGWVPVDVTYGEVFWLDAAHIPIARTADARAIGAEYVLRGRDLTLVPGPLESEVSVLRSIGSVQERLTATLSAQYKLTGSRSGNVLIASVTNAAPYTVVTDVTLLTTSDVKVEDPRSQMVLLPAGATRLVRWRVRMGDYQPQYQYTVPFGVAVRRGGEANTTVKGAAQGTVYPMASSNEVEAGGGLSVVCTEPRTLYVNESTTVECRAPGATVCGDACQFGVANFTFTAPKTGAFPVQINATGGGARGHALVTFIAVEPPKPSINASVSALQSMDDEGLLSFSVESTIITDVTVVVEGAYISQTWTLTEMEDKEFALRFPASLLEAGQNEIRIQVEGSDKNGKRITTNAVAPVYLPASGWDKLKLFFIHLFA